MNDKAIEMTDVGIIGGGQLARMTAERAVKMGWTVAILDPSEDCAARNLADIFICADFNDPDGLRQLVESCRVATFDIEAADAPTLMRLEAEGQVVQPRPSVLATIQDKLLQRAFLADHGLPVPRFADLPQPTLEAMQEFGFPLVQKARRGGYDGRGVAVLRREADFADRITAPSMVEEKIAIDRELAVMVARTRTGQTTSYPVAEPLPDRKTFVLDSLVFPAILDRETESEARSLACKAIDALQGVGIFTVELFMDENRQLWINEISPRPHNAGHVTIEAAATCQFEQHLRAILDLPLGDTRAVSPAAMVNLLGPPDVRGPVQIEGREQALAIPGARLHLYGKSTTWPGRKLGHITVVDTDIYRALQRAREARSLLRFVGNSEVAA